MRIQKIFIENWRHFENINIEIKDQTPLVCLVGANGTGKSHILELIAACAQRLGLSQGLEIPRGDPFQDPHSFALQFYIEAGLIKAVDDKLQADERMKRWNRTLTIHSKKVGNASEYIEAGGFDDATEAVNTARIVVELLRSSQSVHFLSLDADRSYPKKNFNQNEVAAAYEIDWSGAEYTRGRSFRPTTTLYDEWLKFFLGRENQAGVRLLKEARQAKKNGEPAPSIDDPFTEYGAALRKVLPHLGFTGVDIKHRTLLFDTTGRELSFNQLSGGEREIAFLVGQIDRFALTNGLFLLDEPELHLNADLIRAWVTYLTGTMKAGQIWLATHSLEAVEAAGARATFVLERDEQTRKVATATQLEDRPVLALLSRALGTPAFSISQLRFVLVEGEQKLGAREIFYKLAGDPEGTRFIESGSCTEVLRRVDSIKALANESESGIRICGILDRDFRSKHEAEALTRNGIVVMPVHEVENFFLNPATLKHLLAQNGNHATTPIDAIKKHSDARAGAWIFQYAMATPNAKSLPEISPAAKELAKTLDWIKIDTDPKAAITDIVQRSTFDPTSQNKLTNLIEIAVKAYAEIRTQDDLWKACEGKQILQQIAREVGFLGVSSLISATFTAWNVFPKLIPAELAQLRSYIVSV